MARINFVIPSLPTKPVGGVKIMFQFANKLSEQHHDIAIYYAIKRPYKKQRTPVWLRLLISRMRMGSVAKWFTLNAEIHQKVISEVSNDSIRDADATLCTWWQMAYAINELNASKGNKCNLIQDYEIWTGQEDRVHASYNLLLRHCVIAKYLFEIVKKHSGKEPAYTPLAIDTAHFVRSIPSSGRDPHSIIMLYSEEPRKGSSYALEAFNILKQRLPSLKVTLFSVYQRPESIPSWMEFHTRPANLPELYNNSAVFFSPSLGEGWALPPAESMACGCTVVCTDIGGHRDYAIDDETALLVQPKAIDEMVEKVHLALTDNELRLKLAEAGHNLITTRYTWAKSVAQLESILLRKSS